MAEPESQGLQKLRARVLSCPLTHSLAGLSHLSTAQDPACPRAFWKNFPKCPTVQSHHGEGLCLHGRGQARLLNINQQLLSTKSGHLEAGKWPVSLLRLRLCGVLCVFSRVLSVCWPVSIHLLMMNIYRESTVPGYPDGTRAVPQRFQGLVGTIG